MSRAGLSCPGCGSSNIVDDDLYSQAQLVCTDCGSVVSEGVLADDPVGDVSYSRTTAVAKKPCVNQIKGVQRVRAMCRILRVNKAIEELSQDYFNRAYQHESFIKVTLQKKDVLGGCCLLVSCRLLNWPITMGTISSLLDANPAVNKILNLLYCNPYSSVIRETLTGPACRSFVPPFCPLHVSEELAEDVNNLTKRAVALVELAAQSWIVTGRRPVPIMMAAIYLAWQSLKPSKHRLRLTLDKFCQLAMVNRHKCALKRVSEMKGVLRAMRTHDAALHSLTEPAAPSHIAEAVEPSPNVSSVEQREANTDPAENWGKRVLFAPPCVLHAKRRKVQQPGLTDVTGDEEISDSEIDSYIRTPREVRDFALTQEILSVSESNKS
uniref:Transcription factor IIIB 50 kDa subunit n=1 Tax=Mola mola TaxID=94237 RepID=A0A3Q4B007_MOLML